MMRCGTQLRDGPGVFVEVEMATVEHQQGEHVLCMNFPALQHLSVDPMVVATAKYVDVGTDARIGTTFVSVVRVVVGPNRPQ
jgi:hypothetical protein